MQRQRAPQFHDLSAARALWTTHHWVASAAQCKAQDAGREEETAAAKRRLRCSWSRQHALNDRACAPVHYSMNQHRGRGAGCRVQDAGRRQQKQDCQRQQTHATSHGRHTVGFGAPLGMSPRLPLAAAPARFIFRAPKAFWSGKCSEIVRVCSQNGGRCGTARSAACFLPPPFRLRCVSAAYGDRARPVNRQRRRCETRFSKMGRAMPGLPWQNSRTKACPARFRSYLAAKGEGRRKSGQKKGE